MSMAHAPWDGDDTGGTGSNVVELWRGELRYKADGQTLEPKDFGNMRLQMTYHIAVGGKVRLNRFTNEIEVGEVPWRRRLPLRALTDSDIVRTREWLQRIGLQATKEEAHAALVEAADFHAYDPVVDYLTGLQWDAKPRLNHWLTDFLGVEETAYAQMVGSKWLIGAAARALEPGCKMDHMLVLEGPQDLGKSTALRILASPDWFTEFTSDLRNHQKFVEQILGMWIVEFAELAAVSKSEVEMVKAVITMQVDRCRLSYARTVTAFPRRCVLAASVNPRAEGAYLTDETGNKRFWPVRCTHIDTNALRIARDQLWAEAVHRFRLGEPWWLDDHERVLAVDEQADRLSVDPWADWLGSVDSQGYERLSRMSTYTSAEILEKLGVKVADQAQADKNRIAAVMKAIGWVNRVRKIAGKPVRLWEFPTELQ